ncbi:MAG: altronate dehydratase family protein [Faecalimonas sp.]|nr:altronate dehydratase family protein [Faecalimonas sp.]
MKAIKIHQSDKVAVAINTLKAQETFEIDGNEYVAKAEVPAGHKIAIAPMKAGENIIKYGFPIGHAKVDIAVGEHVHSHNVKSNLGDLLEYTYQPAIQEIEKVPSRTFRGFCRKDGKVGISNEVWIVPTVGCVNSIVREIEAQSQQFKEEHIDGIYAYNHPYGCSQLGADWQMTLEYLCGLIRHPNAGAVLVVGLGCENGNIPELKKFLGEYDSDRVKFLVCQEEEDEIAKGVEMVKELCAYAEGFSREECPASELVIGLKCGGSDGFSGITANPLMGCISDKLIAQGGSSILTEVPEMFGAETILMNRCRNEELFHKTVDLINNFKQYFMRYGEKVDENPSPGNKEGGITTLEDKSLGCVQKGGTSPVEDVLKYAEPVKAHGLSLLNAPGNDLVASNALVASGAHVVLFTTGRGTPFGCPVPTVKVSSNTALYNKKKAWIDFNAGALLDGVSMQDLTEEFYEYLLKLASGEVHAKSEMLDKHELAIFKDGVTL